MFDAIRSCFTRLFTPTPTQPIAVIFVTEEPEPARAEVCWATTRPSWDRSPKLASGLVKSSWYDVLVEEFDECHYGAKSWLALFLEEESMRADCQRVERAFAGGAELDELAQYTLEWMRDMYAAGGHRCPAITLDDCKIWILEHASSFQRYMDRWKEEPAYYFFDFDY